MAVRFGKIRIENRPDPVSQFAGSFIGNRTYDWKSWDAFIRLVGRYPSWDAIADAPAADIEAILEGVTFSEKKAPELKQALQGIRTRFGQIDLENLTTLKAFLDKPGLEEAPIRTPLGHGETDLCLKGGLQHGVLHEVFSAVGHETAATGFVAGLAARVAADKHLLWIRQDFSAHEFGELSATGLLELGLDPARMLLLSVANASDGLRAANDALSCAALGAVVIEIPGSPKVLDLVASRRLTLAATQKSTTALLLRFGARPDASTAETRWLVRAAPSQERGEDWGYPAFEANLIRNRHGKTGRWFMEWNCDECVFQSATADHGAMVSAAAN